jgi:hypothetical protein
VIDRQIFPPISPFAPRGELCRAIPEVLIDDGAILRVELEPVVERVPPRVGFEALLLDDRFRRTARAPRPPHRPHA